MTVHAQLPSLSELVYQYLYKIILRTEYGLFLPKVVRDVMLCHSKLCIILNTENSWKLKVVEKYLSCAQRCSKHQQIKNYSELHDKQLGSTTQESKHTGIYTQRNIKSSHNIQQINMFGVAKMYFVFNTSVTNQ